MYHGFALEARNPGGHSSLPRKDNAIYHLAAGLTRLAAFEFPGRAERDHAELLRAHGGARERTAGRRRHAGRRRGRRPTPAAAARLAAASPLYNSMMRTTCVATHADGRPRRERAAAARAGDRELPHAARRADPRGRADADEVVADPGIAVTRSSTGEAEPSLAAAAGRDGGRRAAHQGDVARRRRPADHVDRRDRRAVSAQRRHSDLRRRGHVHRRSTTSARTGRTSGSASRRSTTGASSCTG